MAASAHIASSALEDEEEEEEEYEYDDEDDFVVGRGGLGITGARDPVSYTHLTLPTTPYV